jgi:hypothetical protein
MLALSLSIPAPAANMNQCAELFMTEAPEVIKLEKAEEHIRKKKQNPHKKNQNTPPPKKPPAK